VLVGVLLLLTLSYCLILDLDRPETGSVRVSEASLQRAVAAMRLGEATKSSPAAPGTPAVTLHGSTR
jgi:hypothetical protein